jgi:hypothetical protein
VVRRYERELADARSAYLSAVRRLAQAMNAYQQADVPLDPGTGRDPIPWTREHVTVMIACAQAWRDVVTTRRAYDGIRRDWQSPH